MSWDQQLRHPCRLEWGRDGARRGGRRGDVVVVVDALSFSTSVAYGVDEGLAVMPCTENDDLEALARAERAEIAQPRELASGGLSLSPVSLTGQTFERVLLPSPNGARCVRLAAEAGAACVLVGSFVNAHAVARRATREMDDAAGVTLLACGERWRQHDAPDEGMRVAVEDALAAGCIVVRMRALAGRGQDPRWTSPEARVAEQSWRGVERDEALGALLRACISGLELRRRGFEGDVLAAADVDALEVAPILRDGWLVAD